MFFKKLESYKLYITYINLLHRLHGQLSKLHDFIFDEKSFIAMGSICHN